jgi:hypothetical protein
MQEIKLGRRIIVYAHPDINIRYYFKNNQSKKEWEYGSNGTAPAWQE